LRRALGPGPNGGIDLRQQASPEIQQLFAAALRLHQSGRLNEAQQLYRQVLQVESSHTDALHSLGVLSHQIGHHDVAVDLIGKAIAQNGQVPAFHNNLGNAFKAQGKLEEAAACYGRALSQKPDYVAAHYNLGVALQAHGKLEQAIACYRRALTHQPDHAQAHSNLGNILLSRGQLDQAVACYRQALRHKPNFAEAHGNLANVLKTQGKHQESLASYRRALSHKPDYAEAHNNLGILLAEQGKLDEAVSCYRSALSYKPDYAEAHHYLGNALQELGKSAEARLCYQRALSLKPDYAPAMLSAAVAAIPVLAADETEGAATPANFMRAVDELTPWAGSNLDRLGQAVGSAQPYYLAYRPLDVTAPLCRYGALMHEAATAHWRPSASVIAASSRDRIRMVVVSGQVREHPVWEVILRGIIAHLDRRRFEIILYHTGSIADEETAWARGRVDGFVQGPKPVRGWLDEVASDRPDVMLYPEVGMDPAACALAALRLAPLQVASFGHPVTTGLPSMDLFLSGELLEGPGAEQHYRETLVRLPGTGVCTQWSAVHAQRWEGPDRQHNVVRFALCHQPIKFDPADDVLLTRIAKEAGPSEFWLAAPRKFDWAADRLRDRLASAFRTQGLDPDAYLRVMPWLSRAQFNGFLDEMDIYLDCPAFSGYTTAWQAIHRGLPIVTLEGAFLRQRLAAGLLRQIGSTEGIAHSREQYAETAVRWAQECRRPGTWAARRAELSHAAPTADGNRSALGTLEQKLIDALQKQGSAAAG